MKKKAIENFESNLNNILLDNSTNPKTYWKIFFRSNIWMKSTISLAVTKMSVTESLVLLSKVLVYFLPPT
jgi:hypothetical protein